MRTASSRISATALSILGPLVLGACWTPEHVGDSWKITAMERSRELVPAVDAVGARLVQPHLPRSGGEPLPGDSVVFAMDVESPGSAYRRYLRVSVMPSEPVQTATVTITQTAESGAQVGKRRISSTLRPVQIELFDADGTALADSVIPAALTGLIGRGMFASCKALAGLEAGDVEPEQRAELSLLGTPVVLAMCNMLQDDDTLYDLAFDLVDTSLVFTAVWNFGVSFSVLTDETSAEVVDLEPVTGRPGYRFPVELLANDHPALRLVATVVEPVPPLGIGAGIVRVDGFRPTDARYRVRVRLVAPAAAPGSETPAEPWD